LSRTHLIGSELSGRHLHPHLRKLLLHVRHLHLFSLLSLFNIPLGLLPESVRALFATCLNIHFIEFSALIDLIEPLFVIFSYSFLFLREEVMVAIMFAVLVFATLAHFNY
jgi:hypothetical protein